MTLKNYEHDYATQTNYLSPDGSIHKTEIKAYIYDKDGNFSNHCNTQMVEIEDLEVDDLAELKSMIENHLKYTGSDVAKAILDDWDNALRKFVRVMPIDFKRMLAVMDKMREAGLSGDDAVMAAFENNKRDLSRVGGN